VPVPTFRDIALDLVGRGAAPAVRDWLEGAVRGLRVPLDRPAFAAAFAGAARRLGDAPVRPGAAEAAALAAAGAADPAGRPLHEVGRAALLHGALQALAAAEHAAFVDEVRRHGDAHEQQAVLRALPSLPDAARFVGTATDACRTNVLPVFEAIACRNPYPARHFPDLAFEQMVLKALFVGAPVGAIVGLPDRVTARLRAMVGDLVRERRAAGRPVPSDVDVVLESPGSDA
jgi:hypothetical protein